MHMADALLSPAVGGSFWAASLSVFAYTASKLKQRMDEKLVPLMGVLGAFIFAAQMINFTIPGTGSSGHLGGGMILAVILGPYAAFLVMASVLTIQAFFFADGGILALGCNIWNLGLYSCFIVYPLIYKQLVKSGSTSKRITVASVLSAVIGLQLGAFSVVVQTLLSGRSELPFGTFVLMMLPIHLAIGLVEGFITAGVINYVRVARPGILESILESKPLSAEIKVKNLGLAFLVIAIITGGLMSWFASANPDGLEWSIDKIYGKPELPGQEKGIGPVLKGIQERTAFLPGYSFKKTGEAEKSPQAESAWPNVETGTSLSGLAGSIIVISMVVLIGFSIRTMRKKPKMK